jgi:hypothetical protein
MWLKSVRVHLISSPMRLPNAISFIPPLPQWFHLIQKYGAVTVSSSDMFPPWSYKYIPRRGIKPRAIHLLFLLPLLVLIRCTPSMKQSNLRSFLAPHEVLGELRSGVVSLKEFSTSQCSGPTSSIILSVFISPDILKSQTSLWCNQTLLCRDGAKSLFPTARHFLELGNQWCW